MSRPTSPPPKAATGYPGGKGGAGIVQRFLNLISPHLCYVAPFAGFDAVARIKRPSGRTVLCDLHRPALDRLAAHFRDVAGVELYHTDGVGWLRHRFQLDRLPPNLAPRDPAAEWCDCGSPDVFVFADPPYPRETLSTPDCIYAHELDDAGHDWLLATLVALPCPCMVTCYPNERYNAALARWHSIDYQNCTRGGPKWERCWMNYPPPKKLHDARFVGKNKRQRERMKRRCRNWSAGLRRADPFERQAIMDEIQREFSP